MYIVTGNFCKTDPIWQGFLMFSVYCTIQLISYVSGECHIF